MVSRCVWPTNQWALKLQQLTCVRRNTRRCLTTWITSCFCLLQVHTPKGRFKCRRLIVSAGAWVNHVLGSVGVHIPIKVTQEQVSYFSTPNIRDFTAASCVFPFDSLICWIDSVFWLFVVLFQLFVVLRLARAEENQLEVWKELLPTALRDN